MGRVIRLCVVGIGDAGMDHAPDQVLRREEAPSVPGFSQVERNSSLVSKFNVQRRASSLKESTDVYIESLPGPKLDPAWPLDGFRG